jgi:hypothetical protein
MTGITLAEYNRRWELIMEAFRNGRLSPQQASDAIYKLTHTQVWR